MEVAASFDRNRRFYELDLLRFVAAFEIMMFHYTLYGFPNGYHTLDFTALGETLKYFYFGLELLFMLSGFVILKTVQNKSALGFVSARVVRLYPAYWVCVTLSAVVLLAANQGRMPVGLPQYLANLTMVQTALGFEHIDGVYWTLEVQLLFYAWVFLVCMVKQLHNAGKFLGIWLVAAVFINVFGGITFTKLDYLLLPRLSFYFIAGGAFFLLHQRGRRSPYLWTLVAVCYAMTLWLAIRDPRQGNSSAALVGHTLLFLLFARMVLHERRLTGKRWMVTLFKMTYPLYLMHQNIGYVLLTRSRGFLPKYLALALVIVVMLTASYVISTQIDKWIMPPFKRATDRVLSLLGERPAELRARRSPALAPTGSQGANEIPDPAAIRSADTIRQEAG